MPKANDRDPQMQGHKSLATTRERSTVTQVDQQQRDILKATGKEDPSEH
jgi:hypothetical protein